MERAAKCIWERYSEPLSLADIAKSAMLSRFYLSRIFRAVASVPPCRFLSAVRIYQAKHMLVATSVSITDISFSVGYSSVGSFTSHFTRSVGVSPTLFRRMARDGDFEFPCPGQDSSPAHGAVQGTISLPPGHADARVYLGAFTGAVVEHRPAAAVVVDIPAGGLPSPYRLPDVPPGKWFIHAVGVTGITDPGPWTRRTALVGGGGSVSVTAGTATRATIWLRPRRITDPPVLLALPDLETRTRRSASTEDRLISPTHPDVIPAMEFRVRHGLSATNGRASCGKS
ncbi:MAG: helix-turn-helix transcriptional regulator [Actinobacteria bacterium]|nr:helix-turn-helix transcriptional regulator [Actinomycetota bacterium]